jgi:hypothetical protein
MSKIGSWIVYLTLWTTTSFVGQLKRLQKSSSACDSCTQFFRASYLVHRLKAGASGRLSVQIFDEVVTGSRSSGQSPSYPT